MSSAVFAGAFSAPKYPLIVTLWRAFYDARMHLKTFNSEPSTMDNFGIEFNLTSYHEKLQQLWQSHVFAVLEYMTLDEKFIKSIETDLSGHILNLIRRYDPDVPMSVQIHSYSLNDEAKFLAIENGLLKVILAERFEHVISDVKDDGVYSAYIDNQRAFTAWFAFEKANGREFLYQGL
jgi:hypothetical protein